jgi:hypothetical protein
MEKELSFKNNLQDWWIKWAKIKNIWSREVTQNTR